MLVALGQDQVGPLPGRQDVLFQIQIVDILPDVAGDLGRLALGQLGVVVEVGVRIREGAAAKLEETLDIPGAQQFGVGIHIDGEVDEVRYEDAVRILRVVHAALQHIEPFQDQDVRLLHHLLLIRNDVVDEMGVNGGLDFLVAGADVGDKLHQMADVVGLREPLAAHQAALFQHLVGVEKAVGGDQLHPRVLRPALQQRLHDARRGALAACHTAGDADDVGALAARLTEELFQHPAAALLGLDVEIEQTGEGQIDLFHLLQ